MTNSNMRALVRRAAGHLFGLWLQARSATTHIVNNNEKQRRPSPNHETFSSRRRRCALGPIDFRRVSNTLASSCNLGSCAGPPPAARVSDGPKKNNNEITVEI